MTAAVFDNFMMKIGYGSFATQEFKARTFQMTNWASVFLPAQSVPAPFNIGAMLRDGGIFRSDIALSDFLDLFSPVNLNILNNKRRRWSEFLERLHAARRVRPDGRPSRMYLQSLGGLVTDRVLRGLVKL